MADKRGPFTMVGDLTAAQAALYRKATGGRSGSGAKRRRKRSVKSAASGTKRRKKRRTASKKSGGKMRAGSAAAKAWGRKMKRLRKRK